MKHVLIARPATLPSPYIFLMNLIYKKEENEAAEEGKQSIVFLKDLSFGGSILSQLRPW